MAKLLLNFLTLKIEFDFETFISLYVCAYTNILCHFTYISHWPNRLNILRLKQTNKQTNEQTNKKNPQKHNPPVGSYVGILLLTW